MKAELKRLHSPDAYNLEKFKPQDPTKFSILIQAMIGPEGKEGEESFDIEVCTPRWLEDAFNEGDVIIGCHYIIVMEYNFQKIDRAIRDYIDMCTGKDWCEIAGKLSCLGKWEFEGYIE